MSAGHCKACLTLPEVTGGSYVSKGNKSDVAGLTTYVVGPESKTLILFVYDIFAFTPQAFQGADIIAEACGYKVYMPDWFKGAKRDPNATEEARNKFMTETAAPGLSVPTFNKIVADAKAEGYEKVAAVGFCWGAKLIFSSDLKALDAASGIHPSRLTATDCDDVTIPVGLWPTVDEDKEIFASIKKALEAKPWSDKNICHTYEDRRHGFAGARANLDDEQDRKLFAEGYQNLCDWFKLVL